MFVSRGIVNLIYGSRKKLDRISIGQVWRPGRIAAVARHRDLVEEHLTGRVRHTGIASRRKDPTMEFFSISHDIPFMRHALTFNVISLVTFLLAVFFLATKRPELSASTSAAAR